MGKKSVRVGVCMGMGMGMGTPSRRGREAAHLDIWREVRTSNNGLACECRWALFGQGTSRRGIALWKAESSGVEWSGLVSSTVPSLRVVRTENGSGPQAQAQAAQRLLEHQHQHHHHHQRQRQRQRHGQYLWPKHSPTAQYTSSPLSLLMACTARRDADR
jgi:hypothetical protein